jgi:hypothetical protein
LQETFELPPALLALVLRSVPQQQRLTSCALVCWAWAAAAIVATDSISLAALAASRFDLLQDWLQQHGQHLRAVQIQQPDNRGWRDSNRLVDLALPTASLLQLKSLKLHGVFPKLLRSANSSAAASPASSSSRGNKGSSNGSSDFSKGQQQQWRQQWQQQHFSAAAASRTQLELPLQC